MPGDTLSRDARHLALPQVGAAGQQKIGAGSALLIGMGGIVTAEDALQFILAGASAVQVGTANFVRPTAAVELVSGLEAYLERHGIASVRELVGALEVER